ASRPDQAGRQRAHPSQRGANSRPNAAAWVNHRRTEGSAPDVASRADGTADIGILIALISGLVRTAATLGPLIDKAVHVSNARLVLEPDLNWRSRPDRLLRLFSTVFAWRY